MHFFGYRLVSSWLLVLSTAGVLAPPQAAFASDREEAEVRDAISKKGAKWQAKKNAVSELSAEGRKGHLGVLKDSTAATATATGTTSGTGITSAPAAFDWRSNNGMNYVSPVKNQGSCGSCWAFATSAALESQMLMGGAASADVSEQVMLSCSGAGSCNGGYPSSAASYIAGTGLPAESYFPYTATDSACANATSGWQNYANKITSWNSVSQSASAIQSALVTYGPLVTTMAVYDDFFYYSSGVYQHTTGNLAGYHAILIVGYDAAAQYFVVKNSWGTGWGEGGFFRIGFSEITNAVGFGAGTIAYYTSNALPSIAISSPNGGETLNSGVASQIRWNYAGNPGPTVNVDLYKGGSLYQSIAAGVSIGSGGMGSYSWAVPAGLTPGSDYQVAVTSVANPAYTSKSAAMFTIAPPPPPPSAPSNVKAVLNTYQSGKGRRATSVVGVGISFSASTSGAGVSYYSIYRNGSLIATTTTLSFEDKGTVAGGGTYSYTVQAVDKLGQLSTMSSASAVTR